MSVSLESIRAAAERIRGAVYRSPCHYSHLLSRFTGAKVYCKLDHLQLTGSFKERGARNKLAQLSPEQKQRGVIAASAGNHASALAYHGQQLGVPVTVVMPVWAPMTKVSNCRSFGATVVQQGDSFAEAMTHARQLCEQKKLTYVHGFDDPDVISGQGTVGLEILEDVPEPDAVIVPVGGGGLIAGVGAAIKALRPATRVIGVETANAPTYYESRRAGKVVKIDSRFTLADGLAIAEVGQLCFEIAQKVVDDVVLVDEAHIARAVLKLLEMEKQVLEGAGAAPLAAMLQRDLDLSGKIVVLCLCGGNIDVAMLGKVIERGLASDGRLCRLVCTISDRPGGLAKLTRVLADAGASVNEITHDRNFAREADVQSVDAVCVLETRDHDHIRAVREALSGAGIAVRES
ncbi:MAG: threonine ammonia-lyase [Tepidisphaeraceae bacterium]